MIDRVMRYPFATSNKNSQICALEQRVYKNLVIFVLIYEAVFLLLRADWFAAQSFAAENAAAIEVDGSPALGSLHGQHEHSRFSRNTALTVASTACFLGGLPIFSAHLGLELSCVIFEVATCKVNRYAKQRTKDNGLRQF